MKKGDFAIIGAVAIIMLTWILMANKGTAAAIYVDGKLYKRMPLDKDAAIVVESEWGTNTVVIQDKTVKITDADCDNKDCERSTISKTQHSLVCLPNRLTVIVENNETKDETDVILQ